MVFIYSLIFILSRCNFLQKKNLSKFLPEVAEIPNLIEIQLESFNWLTKVGLRELFTEVSPIEDWTGEEYELHFIDYRIEEPKLDQQTSKEKNMTFESPLRVKLKLETRKREHQKNRKFI